MVLPLLLFINLWTAAANQAGSFSLFPKNATQIQGLEVEFLCRHSTASRIVWSVDGTYLYILNYDEEYIISRQNQYSDGMEVYRLTITAIPEYNGTRIQCHARFSDGSPEQASKPATLFIQGTLAAVGDLRISISQFGLSVLWTAPLTFSDTECYITYCIDVHNNSDRSHVISECGINETRYNLIVNNSTPCDSVTITVTPVNRAGNGTQQNIDGYFFNVPDDVSVGNITAYRSENITLFTIAIPYTPICTCGLAVAMLSEDIGKMYAMVVVGCDSRNITLYGDLPHNHHYNLRVEIHNSAGTGYLNVCISTYDVQDVDNSDISRNNTVFMRFRFLQNSSVMGAFVILARLYPDGSVRLNESIYATSPRHGNTSSVSILNVPLGIYNVLVYDIESNGLLSAGEQDEMTVASPALDRGPIAVLGSSRVKYNITHTTSDVRNIKIQPVKNTTMINVNCTLHEASTARECIVIVQSTTNMYPKLIIKVLPRTSNEGAMIDLPGDGWYHVRVYPWTSGGLLTSDVAWVEDILVAACSISDSSISTVAEDASVVTIATGPQPVIRMTFIWISITLGVVLIMVVSLLLVAICMIITKGKQNNKNSQTEETSLYEQVAEQTKQTEVIYDQPQTPPPQPENMHPCVAYEVSRRRR